MDEQENRRIMENFLRKHGVSDKDSRPARRPRSFPKSAGLEKTRKGLLRKVIDLHGMTVDNAEPALSRAIEDCKRSGVRELLVIHGWGRHSNPAEGGILKKMVIDALKYRYELAIRDYAAALPRDGGEGATVVRLK